MEGSLFSDKHMANTGAGCFCYHEKTPLIETVPDILARIVATKREELSQARFTLAELARKARDADGQRRVFTGRGIIAEIKKASPSKGLLAADFDPPRIARAYEAGGAAALSVLTDEQYFQGSLRDLGAAREAVGLPVLRKDFTLEPYHVLEAAAHGADAILLIAAILETSQIRGLCELAAEYGMAALVEVHDEAELDRALAASPSIVGVNNRDLRTFKVGLETSLQLAGRIPSGIVKVSESGIHSAEDVRTLRAAGFEGFLVGEHLMASGDPTRALKELAA
jgi:indole-3-glycerol phosphate synthase